MEKEERIKIEITSNTTNHLLYQFDQLLLGLDTDKYAFDSSAQKERKVKAIQSFIHYRIKEKIIDQKSDLWKMLKEIKTKDIGLKKTAFAILKKLLRSNTHKTPPIKDLNSKEAKRISKYLKQKAREDNMKRGDGVLARLFRFFER